LARLSPAECIYRKFLKVPGGFGITKTCIRRLHDKIC
jgi:hypothetical protein